MTKEEYIKYLSNQIEMLTYFEEGTGCRIWCGETTSSGYGVLRTYGHRVPVHRIAYAIECGPIPADKFVLHHCDNPPCCRVSHLYLGTAKDNRRDCVKRGRQKGQASVLL